MLQDKVALVTGIANQRSIAYGIALELARHGARLIVVAQNERLRSRAEDLCAKCKDINNLEHTAILCDVAHDEEIESLVNTVSGHTDCIDVLVHSIAFANRDEIKGAFHSVTTRQGFSLAHDISSYSLIALTRSLLPLMQKAESASVLTMTYFGSEKAIPNYNVMGVAKSSLESCVRYLAHSLGEHGIRVNALSPGPIQTLAASGISGLSKMLEATKNTAPLKRPLTTQDVGNVAAFLASDLASAISGEIIHVDNGFHCVGMHVPV